MIANEWTDIFGQVLIQQCLIIIPLGIKCGKGAIFKLLQMSPSCSLNRMLNLLKDFFKLAQKFILSKAVCRNQVVLVAGQGHKVTLKGQAHWCRYKSHSTIVLV